MNAWFDEMRRTQARAAIDTARKRLAVTITHEQMCGNTVWRAVCHCATTHPTLHEAETWATRHECAR